MAFSRFLPLPLAAVGLLALGGCPQTVGAPAGGHQAEARAKDATPYAISVEAPDAAAGAEAIAKVHVVPQHPWHMNLEFPAALRMEAPDGVTLTRAEQRRGDAERYDDDGLVFAVPFTPDHSGAKRFEGELQFAVCEAEACSPISVPVDFTVEVGCRELEDTGTLC